jgi:uncharacterized protein YbbC (DUF1343 family)
VVGCGCDILADEKCAKLAGRRVGLLANPASVTHDLRHTADLLLSCAIDLRTLFGPQHGYRGDTQANMIEWKSYTHPRLGIPVYSLYGEDRRPHPGMLEGLDIMVIDLPDVGARPYTYLWTAVLAVEACAASGMPVLVLDRPNPIGGVHLEGPALEEQFRSFVGLHPILLRHGCTMCELIAMISAEKQIDCELETAAMRGWERTMFFEATGMPWVLTSPNIPTADTAVVYPGMVLLEGTNISEGRGTTRPFEIAGAPWIDPDDLVRELSAHRLDGVTFRPHFFTPTWDKYRDTLCGGVQIHVTDRECFEPVLCGVTIIATAARLYPEHFAWKDPPYEYEYDKPPVDILYGSTALREAIRAGEDVSVLAEGWRDMETAFAERRKPYLLYR